MKPILKFVKHLAIGVAALAGSQLTAQTEIPLVEVTISGGNGSRLTVELPRAVTFTNVPEGETQYGFVLIEAAGDNNNVGNSRHDGTMNWGEAGGSSSGDSGTMGVGDDGDLTRNHIFAYWASDGNQGATTGTMTLSAGTRRTTGNINVSPTIGTGKYQIRMMNEAANFIGDSGTQPFAPVDVRISGGSGTPVTIQLFRDIIFSDVPTDTTGSYGFALIDAAKGNMATAISPHSGTMTWNDSTNTGTGNLRVDDLGELTRDDIFAFWSSDTAPTLESTMTLSAGTRMTANDIDAAVLSGEGRYVIRMIRGGGVIIGNPGVEANVRITGGSGTPLSVELLRTVTFNNVPNVSGSYGVALIGAAQGNTVTSISPHSGTMTWNNSTNTGSGNLRVDNFGELTRSDIFAFWNRPPAPGIQSTMTLSAGTRMTADNIDAAVLTGSGRYVIRMIRSGGNFIGDPGVITLKTIALDKIAAYADSDSNLVPTVQDYADAGVTDVTEDNLAAVNAAVAVVAKTEADTTAEIQTLVDAAVAALAKISAYADDDSNPEPTVQDYMNAGVTDVTADNLAAVNEAVAAVSGMDADTTAEIQTLVDAAVAALAKISAYADDDSNPEPTVQDYMNAGVTDVTADNLAAVNEAVAAVSGTEADTTAEIQALVDALAATPTTTQITFINFDSNTQTVTLRWLDTGGSYTIQVGNDLEWNSPTSIRLDGSQNDLGDEIEFSFTDSGASGAVRFWRVIVGEVGPPPDPTTTPTQITSVDFDSATQTVTLRWLDTGDSYSIQASDDLDWGTASSIPLNGTETDLGDEIEFSFTDSSATGATRFWRVVTTD